MLRLQKKDLVEALTRENSVLLADLKTLAEDVSMEVVPATSDSPAFVRLAGGYGLDREAVRLTLETIVAKGFDDRARIKSVFDKHRANLEEEAQQLGRKAVYELNLRDIHPNLQKMIGALNWRTSYRQNQYFHSLEVAMLAGVLAGELGLNQNAAKRCGILHDIGKSLDYKIEGSHAIISADYADRYGESKEICDTILSHHSDMTVETPLAYVLAAADTLSGARPGSRINLEEGYQDRLASIQDVVRGFPGVSKVEIMYGAREVHVEVNHKAVRENELQDLSSAIARKIEQDVSYPGQIKVMVTRRFEAVVVA